MFPLRETDSHVCCRGVRGIAWPVSELVWSEIAYGRRSAFNVILIAGREIFVGLSSRTNLLGAQAVAKAFPEYPTNIVQVRTRRHDASPLGLGGNDDWMTGFSRTDLTGVDRSFLNQFTQQTSVTLLPFT